MGGWVVCTRGCVLLVWTEIIERKGRGRDGLKGRERLYIPAWTSQLRLAGTRYLWREIKTEADIEVKVATRWAHWSHPCV